MKQQIQKFGRALSAMVMPNIGAFIAWGLITAIFIKGGWWPNENIAKMISPMLTYMLPLLIAYTAGKNVAGVRGGVAGVVATMGVIIGSNTPMFLGAMIMGPLAGWIIKKFDSLVQDKVGAGFEMLVDNFSLGIISMLLAVGGYLVVGGVINAITVALSHGVNWMLAHKLNPLLSLIVDPAKVLFLNNAVNHGIMTPLGIQQAAEFGHSMLFLVDPNPGPGLGVLLACWAFGKGSTKQSAPGAVIIQLFGGIHEIYFPYVLARPVLLLPVIAGNVCALSFFTLVDFGLVAPASPGSIISIILMSPRGKVLLGLLGVAIATGVSFLLSWPFIKRRPDFQEEVAEGTVSSPAGSGVSPVPVSGVSSAYGVSSVRASGASSVRVPGVSSVRGVSQVLGGSSAAIIRKIVFACDAGMGSSALGATRFKSRLLKADMKDIVCTNSAVDAIPDDASVVVCQTNLAERAAHSGKEIIAISNFLKDPALDALLQRLVDQEIAPSSASPEDASVSAESPLDLLLPENILTGLVSEPKEDAILRAGELLFKSGYVGEDYIPAMMEREKIATTYMGMGLAIPHGTESAKAAVKHSGIVVLQYPEGVEFEDGEKARLVIGIAGAGDEHIAILAKVAGALEDSETLELLSTTSDANVIYQYLK